VNMIEFSMTMPELGIHLCCYTYWFTIQIIESLTETLYIYIKTFLISLTQRKYLRIGPKYVSLFATLNKNAIYQNKNYV